jgi:chromatin segregation and condensation protein Rec8/ScpA/Scc1 (kleisin family)
MLVRELELDLDAFEGPFDLLLTLLLREELEPAEVDMAAIVVAFVDRLAEREELDLEACGEFLVLIAALLELKARALFPDEEAELAEPAPQVSLAHMSLRFPPVSQFLERFRAVLRRRRRFDFDAEVGELSRVDQAVAFLALLELRKTGEVSLEQAAPFSPIRVSRSHSERGSEWIVRSA